MLPSSTFLNLGSTELLLFTSDCRLLLLKLKLAKESTTEPLLEASDITLFVIELILCIVKMLGCFTGPLVKIFFFSLKLRLLPIEN